MFTKLAIKNIQRSIKDYAIYFFTLVLGVAIFYVFNALGTQAVMLDVTERVRSMLELMNVILGVVSVFISFILGALIIYASRFLIKRRSKEFGIYMTLGMGKRRISLILLIETFFIGLLSLATGLILGIVASQFTSVLVANMFDANLTEFHFVFSASAFFKTLAYFGVIYLIVMVFNTIIVSRQKLINLLSSSRRSEKVKLKNLWLCTAVFIIAATMLGYAYYLVTAGLQDLVVQSDGPEVLLIPIAMGLVATFLLFWSLSGLLLRIFMSFKGIYYKKLNAFVLRQFSSKINTTVASMGTICLMLFVTICVLGSAISINVSLHETIERNLPVDVEITRSSSIHNVPSIAEAYTREGINIHDLLKDIIVYPLYTVYDIVASNVPGEVSGAVSDASNDTVLFQIPSGAESVIKVSDYNRLAPVFHLEPLELAANEYAILANYQPVVEIRDMNLAKGQTLTFLGQTFYPKYDKCIHGTIELEMSSLNYGVIIVPDSVKLDSEEDVHEYEVLLGNYIDSAETVAIDEALNSINNRFFRVTENDEPTDAVYYYSVDSRQEIIDNNVGTSALVTFIGMYLGVIFLISSAAILALKELSESSDNRQKYSILRKIGASDSMLSRALFWQIFIFFLFPLLIAIIHSVFGLMFCDFMLLSVGGINISGALPWVAVIMLAVYGGYFIITYVCSRNMIRERRK